MSDFDVIDFSDPDGPDPCALLPHYRRALAELETGQAAVRVKVDDHDEVEYQRANVSQLRLRVAELEDACRLKNGMRRKRRRRAFRASFR